MSTSMPISSPSTIYAIVHEAIEVAEFENRKYADLRVYPNEWASTHDAVVKILTAEMDKEVETLRWIAIQHPLTEEPALQYTVSDPKKAEPRFSFFLTATKS